MTKDEALKLALEALEHEAKIGNDDAYKLERDAIKETLAQPEQEPVGWLDSNDKLAEFMHKDLKAEHDKRDSSTPRYFQIPVYTTPPQRTWVGLTDEEISAIDWKSDETLHDFARAIEAKLKEKNT